MIEDDKIEEATMLLEKGRKFEFEELLSKLFEQYKKLTEKQKDRLLEIFALSRS